MATLPHQERSLVLLKPDAVQRSLVGEVIKRFEQTGLKISAMKMIIPTQEQLLVHYNKDDSWYERKGKGIVEELTAQGKPIEKEAIEYREGYHSHHFALHDGRTSGRHDHGRE